jgi:hypothetical protein
MGLAPYTRSPGITPPTAVDDSTFHPIPLSAFPIHNNEDDSGLPSGFIFGPKTGDFDLGNPDTWRGRFHLRDTFHEGIAGLTSDGFMIYAFGGRIDGHQYTAMGAFDPNGKPTPPTPMQKSILEKYIAPSPKPIAIDTYSKSAVGLKMTDPRLGIGAYVGNQEAIFVVHGAVNFGDTSISGQAQTVTDWDGEVIGRGGSITAKNGGTSFTGDWERNGNQIVRKVDATMGRFSVNGQYNTTGSKQDRQLGLQFKATKWATFSIAYKPDNKPSATRLTPYQISQQLQNPTQPMPDYSQISLKAIFTF